VLIRIRDLTKVYKMGTEEVRALDGVDVDIQRGEYVAIMGASGSGKSTLMNILGCLDTPTDGTYSLDGETVSDLNEDQLAAIRNRKIGFVFQTFNLLPRSIAFHNVELPLIYAGVPKGERKKRVEHALDLVDLGNRAGHKPGELSGGQRQRVAIARALVNEPSLVLADEPTGNLDEHTSREVMALFSELVKQAGSSLLMVTHSRAMAKFMNRRVNLHNGKLAESE